MDRILSNEIAENRRARNWSQKELARRSGVSRAEVSALEIGRQSPSTATAIALAEAFGLSVEDLFRLSPSPSDVSSATSWAWRPTHEDQRFWEAYVADRLLRFPVEATAVGSLPHDGCIGPDALAPKSWSAAEKTLVIAGCDPAVGLLAAELARREGIRLIPLTRSSRDALELLKRGLVHAAGVHWSGASAKDPNSEMVNKELGDGYELVHVTRWEEGIALDRSVRARSVTAITRSKLRWIAREHGSGARQVLDRLLGARGSRLKRTAGDHRAVALAIQSGYAQVGIAVRLAAEEAGLNFVRVQEEDYELCFRRDDRAQPMLRALRNVLRRAELKRLTRDLPGRNASRMGEERPVA